MSRTIGQKNVASGNFTANCVVAQKCFISKGELQSEGNANFPGGLDVDIIKPLSSGGTVKITGLEAVDSIILPGQIVIYVGKHGDNAKNGQHVSQAVLDFATAIVRATVFVPAANNIIQIICVDALEYTEDITVPQWINISAPNATINGTVITMGNNVVSFGTVQSSTSAVMSAGPNTSIDIHQLNITSTGVGVDHTNASPLLLRIDIANVGAGILVRTNSGPIDCNIRTIILNGGTAFMVVGNSLTAYVDTITETIPSTAINVIAGGMTAYMQTINTTVASSVGAAGTLNMIANVSLGANLNTGVSNILKPEHVNDFNNPHQVTFDQVNAANPIIASKGEILAFDGVNLVSLGAGVDTQVLIADPTTATGLRWGAGGGGGGSTRTSFNLTNVYTEISDLDWKKASSFQWFQIRFALYSSGVLLLRVEDPCMIRLRNIDLGVDLCTFTVAPAGVGSYSVPITNPSLPVADADLELQVMRTPGVVIPVLHSAVLEFDV
jgi:hypothetical protein